MISGTPYHLLEDLTLHTNEPSAPPKEPAEAEINQESSPLEQLHEKATHLFNAVTQAKTEYEGIERSYNFYKEFKPRWNLVECSTRDSYNRLVELENQKKIFKDNINELTREFSIFDARHIIGVSMNSETLFTIRRIIGDANINLNFYQSLPKLKGKFKEVIPKQNGQQDQNQLQQVNLQNLKLNELIRRANAMQMNALIIRNELDSIKSSYELYSATNIWRSVEQAAFSNLSRLGPLQITETANYNECKQLVREFSYFDSKSHITCSANQVDLSWINLFKKAIEASIDNRNFDILALQAKFQKGLRHLIEPANKPQEDECCIVL